MDPVKVFVTLCASIVVCSGAPASRPLPYYIIEELTANTLMGNVAIDAKLQDQYSPATLRLLTYRISRQVNEAGDHVNLFSIDSRNSILKTVVRIDRDVICPKMDLCVIYLDIEVSAPRNPTKKIIRATVEIIDINDHVPQFPDSMIYKKVSESAEPGTAINLPPAVDLDSSALGINHYELVSSTDKFELKVFPRANGAAPSMALIVKEKLDREQAHFYQFKLLAYDGDSPPKIGSVLVNIEIEDSNDNDPKFENTTYEVYVMENAPVGITVGRVNARDLDLGDNAALSYSFSEDTVQNYGHMFGIREDSGVVYLKESLDFEIKSTYLLTVVAHDHGPFSLPAHATVIVRVEDENDHPPQISINTKTPSGKVLLGEEVPIGSFVAHVSVEDLDGGDNGRVRCVLDGVSDIVFTLQDMFQTQYNIVTNTELTSDTPKSFEMQVFCSDLGKNPMTSTATVDVQIVDANHNSPVFSQRTYTATIDENNVIGYIITIVTASDPDQGRNGEVRYAIHEDNYGDFSVDEKSGIVTTNQEFDRESTHTVDIKVIAYDLGKPESLTSTSTILLTIVDVDDEPPVFNQQQYSFGTYENQMPNAEVGAVKATDKDGTPHNKFQYKFLDPRSEGAQTFTIHPITGYIYTKRPLDRESKPVYYMTIIAQGVASEFTGTTSVTVYVADKNDNSPYVSWPTETNNTVNVPSVVPFNHKVAKVLATDQDLGNNGKLDYSIISGDDGVFTINQASGVISLTGDMAQVEDRIYRLSILVKDQGVPELLTATFLNVVVNKSIVYAAEPVKSSPAINNTTIIASLTSAGLVLIFLLVVAVVLIKRQSQERKEKTYTNNLSDPDKVQQQPRTEAQNILTPREDLPDGRESSTRDWPPTPVRRDQSGLPNYYQQHEQTNRESKITMDENNMNVQVEHKLHNDHNILTKRPPTLTIHDILKPSADPCRLPSGSSLRLSGGLPGAAPTGAFSRSLTSPRCLTLTSPPAFDDPVLKEVETHQQHIEQPEPSPSAKSSTSNNSTDSTNILVDRDYNDYSTVSKA